MLAFISNSHVGPDLEIELFMLDEVVERLSGRTVDAFISNYHVGPDLAVELFLARARDL